MINRYLPLPFSAYASPEHFDESWFKALFRCVKNITTTGGIDRAFSLIFRPTHKFRLSSVTGAARRLVQRVFLKVAVIIIIKNPAFYSVSCWKCIIMSRWQELISHYFFNLINLLNKCVIYLKQSM